MAGISKERLGALKKQLDSFVQINKAKDSTPVSVSVGDLYALIGMAEGRIPNSPEPPRQITTISEPSGDANEYINKVM